jgi:hypothetical protein
MMIKQSKTLQGDPGVSFCTNNRSDKDVVRTAPNYLSAQPTVEGIVFSPPFAFRKMGFAGLYQMSVVPPY